jgi:hypothetical protein
MSKIILYKINGNKTAIPDIKGIQIPTHATDILKCDSNEFEGLTIYDIDWTSEGLIIDPDATNSVEKEILRNQYKSERVIALNNAEVEIDGMVFDVRPQDLSNLEIGIATNEIEWILKDNSVAPVTTEQLQQVLDAGIVQAKAIWQDYKNKLKTL